MTNADRSLSGRAVLVTGVSREIGIGAAIAREVADRGADVFIASWPGADAEQSWGASPQFADELVRQLRATGVRAGHLPIDLADPTAPAALKATCEPGERYESFPNAGLGEPLIVVITEPHGVRVGVFAAYGSGAEGRISRVSKDRFVRRARELDCVGFIFVNGMLHDDDLDYLVTGIEEDNGPTVEVEAWQGPQNGTKLRPAVECVRRRVLCARESASGHA